jgi:hypothetical protein
MRLDADSGSTKSPPKGSEFGGGALKGLRLAASGGRELGL